MCGAFGLWGVVYLVIGIARKVRYQAMTGLAVILLAASMPMMTKPRLFGWLLVAAALPLGVAALVMRVIALFGKRS